MTTGVLESPRLCYEEDSTHRRDCSSKAVIEEYRNKASLMVDRLCDE